MPCWDSITLATLRISSTVQSAKLGAYSQHGWGSISARSGGLASPPQIMDRFEPTCGAYLPYECMTETSRSQAPRGLQRLIFRVPICLYRVRLGFLLGERFLLLTHVGRKSGLTRHTVIEVVHHDQGTDTYFVVSAWGERSDWLRNIQKTASVIVTTGRRRFPAMAARLPISEARLVLLEYAQRHPLAFRAFSKLLIGRPLGATEEDLERLARLVLVIALHARKSERKATGGHEERSSQQARGGVHEWLTSIQYLPYDWSLNHLGAAV